MTDLIPRIEWNRLWLDSDAEGNGSVVFEELVGLYGAARRHYHTLTHVMWVLRRIDEIVETWSGPWCRYRLHWAAWYHDAVMDGASGDEFASAELARKTLNKAGLGIGDDVARLILATTHDKDPKGMARILVDADIAILGADREHFDEYERLVRLEWPDVSDANFAAGRSAILQRFLDRPSIYFTEYARERWEAKARENLAYSIGKLKGG